MYCAADLTAQDEDRARRVYSYFIFRLRQPEDAERLTRRSFERVWEAQRLGGDADEDPDLTLFAAARAVIAVNPRRRGASRVVRSKDDGGGGGPTGLSDELAIAIGRLHGRERDALALRFGAELTIGEIAELLDRTPADIKQRLARGVRSLSELGVLPKQQRGGRSAAKRPRPGGPKGGNTEQR
jgi:DNA-directed RNA polymerase specialized sigma24 family protein